MLLQINQVRTVAPEIQPAPRFVGRVFQSLEGENMYKIRALFLTLMISTTLAHADMPKELQGSWILDSQATEKNILTSSRIKPQEVKYLPTAIKRMSTYVWEFANGTITASRGKKGETLEVILKEKGKNKYVFEGRMNEQIILMTVVFVSEGVINIRSSATDDMKYYLWKRGQLDMNKEKNDDASLAVELMEKSLSNSSAKTNPGDGK